MTLVIRIFCSCSSLASLVHNWPWLNMGSVEGQKSMTLTKDCLGKLFGKW